MPDVYRAYGAGNVLLYVGMSGNGQTRLMAHKLKSAWYVNMVRQKIKLYPTYLKARHAEGIAIYDENPMHNIHIPKFATGPVFPLAIGEDDDALLFDNYKGKGGDKSLLRTAVNICNFDVTMPHLARRYGPRAWFR